MENSRNNGICYHVGSNLVGYLPQSEPSAHGDLREAMLAFADVLSSEANAFYEQHMEDVDESHASSDCIVCDSLYAADMVYEAVQSDIKGRYSEIAEDIKAALASRAMGRAFTERIENETHVPLAVWIEEHEHTDQEPCLVEQD